MDNNRPSTPLFERPVPIRAPGPTFPEPVRPFHDPEPWHPDYEDRHVMIAAASLDPGIAA